MQSTLLTVDWNLESSDGPCFVHCHITTVKFVFIEISLNIAPTYRHVITFAPFWAHVTFTLHRASAWLNIHARYFFDIFFDIFTISSFSINFNLRLLITILYIFFSFVTSSRWIRVLVFSEFLISLGLSLAKHFSTVNESEYEWCLTSQAFAWALFC